MKKMRITFIMSFAFFLFTNTINSKIVLAGPEEEAPEMTEIIGNEPSI